MLPYRRASRLLNAVIVICILILLYLLLSQPSIDDGGDVNTAWIRDEHAELGRVVAQLRQEKADEDHVVARPPDGERALHRNQVETSVKGTGVLASPVDAPDTRDAHSAGDRASKEISGWAADLRRGTKLDPDGGDITGKVIVDSVNFLNEQFDVLNVDRLGPVQNSKTIIVIQVHSRLEYLRYLVDTLSKVRGIEDALLVFSHDVNIEAIDTLIRNITFARVLQIFYPYNMQLFPSVFPGQDPRDCKEKMGKEAAKAEGCQNWESPDKYGNYRVARFTQIKHHWWWKMNYIFDAVVTKWHLEKAWVLLLEEDHYVSPDALHVLDSITERRKELCSDCELISLGFYLKSFGTYGSNIDRLGVHPWFSSKHNMGMALRAETWAKVKNCSQTFCQWDDYNWDWSLLQISVKCLPQRFKVIFTKAPRVLHVGDCGVHTHRCAVHNAAKAAADLFKEHSAVLFPSELRVTEVSKRMLKPSKENGGWGDARDRALCARNTNPLRQPREDDEGYAVLNDLLASHVNVTFSNLTIGGYPTIPVQPRG